MSLADDTDEAASTRQNKRSFATILAYLWRHWSSQPGKLTALLILYTLAAVAELSLPWISAHIVDGLSADPVIGSGPVFDWFAVFAAAAVSAYILRNLAARFWNRFASHNMKRITLEAFADVQRFSTQWHADNFAGATVRRVSRAMHAYDTISDTVVWYLLPATMVLGGLIVVIALRWPMLGLFTGLSVAVFVTVTTLLSRFYIGRMLDSYTGADTRIGAVLADSVSSNATVKAFGAEARELARLETVTEHWRGLAQRTWNRFTDAWAVQNLVLWVLQVGLLGLVLLMWRRGEATPGDAAFALTCFFLMASYLRTFGENLQNLQRGFADIEDAVAYRDEPESVADAPGAPAFVPGAGKIEFRSVAFGYGTGTAPLYRDFQLVIEPGETVALVGATGSGKSTFVKLLQRLYDVDGGAIVVDGQDVRQVAQSSLRAAIALVPQDPALFHRTLRENIAYARPDATLEQVQAAARRADAAGFIEALPQGYDTEVGERGVKLSGGERQRVALARAFLADAAILVLDEATSSLDNETERSVQAAMQELTRGRTTIVVAHRLSTVRDASRILVFDRGRIIEQGTHAELVARPGGAYARLHALSQGDRLGGDGVDLHMELAGGSGG
jgi:ATP-binding cassette, subfamily B, bacterial